MREGELGRERECGAAGAVLVSGETGGVQVDAEK
jgi:hypothetical protein